jgi:SAM-dependent methyltransferase
VIAVPRPLVADARLYGRDADLYDRIYGRPDLYERATEFVLAQIGEAEAPRILDLCTGTGTHARYFAAGGARVLGVDRSAEMIAIARAKAPGARFVVADVVRVKVPGPFHAVTCLYGGIHYVEEPADVQLLLTRCRELLVPGGVLVFELRDRSSVSTEPLYETRAGLEITTLWQPGRGIHGSDLYVIAAYDAYAARQFVEVHNLFLTDPDAFVGWAQAVGFVGVELRAGYGEGRYVPGRGSDVAVLIARSPTGS